MASCIVGRGRRDLRVNFISNSRFHGVYVDCPMKSRISRKPETKYIATFGGNMENKDPRILQI